MVSSFTKTTEVLSRQPKRKIYVFYDASGEKREYVYEPNQLLATRIRREDQLDHSSSGTKYYKDDGGKPVKRHTALHLLNRKEPRAGKPNKSRLSSRTQCSGLEQSTTKDHCNQNLRQRSQSSRIALQTCRPTNLRFICRNIDRRNLSTRRDEWLHWVNYIQFQKLRTIANQWLGNIVGCLLLLITDCWKTIAPQGAIAMTSTTTAATNLYSDSTLNMIRWLSLCMPCVVPFDPRERQSIELNGTVLDL